MNNTELVQSYRQQINNTLNQFNLQLFWNMYNRCGSTAAHTHICLCLCEDWHGLPFIFLSFVQANLNPHTNLNLISVHGSPLLSFYLKI